MTKTKKSALASKEQMPREKTEAEREAEEKWWQEHVAKATEEAEYALSDARNLIYEYEESDGEMEEEDLLSDLDCIRDRLDDCAEDGWPGYRDAMDDLSNELWFKGIAWPQQLPIWSWADVVDPEDVKIPIHDTCLYEDDFLAIRKFSDKIRRTFKDTVHELMVRGMKSYEASRRASERRAKARKKNSKAKCDD